MAWRRIRSPRSSSRSTRQRSRRSPQRSRVSPTGHLAALVSRLPIALRARLAVVVGAEAWARERLNGRRSWLSWLVRTPCLGDPDAVTVKVTRQRSMLSGSTVDQGGTDRSQDRAHLRSQAGGPRRPLRPRRRPGAVGGTGDVWEAEAEGRGLVPRSPGPWDGASRWAMEEIARTRWEEGSSGPWPRGSAPSTPCPGCRALRSHASASPGPRSEGPRPPSRPDRRSRWATPRSSRTGSPERARSESGPRLD